MAGIPVFATEVAAAGAVRATSRFSNGERQLLKSIDSHIKTQLGLDQSKELAALAADYAILTTDGYRYFIANDAIAITLPAAADSIGRSITFLNAGTGAVTIVRNADAANIAGVASTYALGSTAGATIQLLCDGDEWHDVTPAPLEITNAMISASAAIATSKLADSAQIDYLALAGTLTTGGAVTVGASAGTIDQSVAAGASPAFTSAVLTTPVVTTNGSIDVSAAGTLAIGTSIGTNALSLGSATGSVACVNDLSVASALDIVGNVTNDSGTAIFNPTSAGATALRAIKGQAKSGTDVASVGDLIGCYGVSTFQDGTGTHNASATMAGLLSWTEMLDTNVTFSSGGIFAGARVICETVQDLDSIAGGGESALIYAQAYNNATGGNLDYGVAVVNNQETANKNITSALYAHAEGGATFTNIIDCSTAAATNFAKFADGIGGANVGGMDKDPSAVASDGYLQLTIGGVGYQIPVYAGTT